MNINNQIYFQFINEDYFQGENGEIKKKETDSQYVSKKKKSDSVEFSEKYTNQSRGLKNDTQLDSNIKKSNPTRRHITHINQNLHKPNADTNTHAPGSEQTFSATHINIFNIVPSPFTNLAIHWIPNTNEQPFPRVVQSPKKPTEQMLPPFNQLNLPIQSEAQANSAPSLELESPLFLQHGTQTLAPQLPGITEACREVDIDTFQLKPLINKTEPTAPPSQTSVYYNVSDRIVYKRTVEEAHKKTDFLAYKNLMKFSEELMIETLNNDFSFIEGEPIFSHELRTQNHNVDYKGACAFIHDLHQELLNQYRHRLSGKTKQLIDCYLNQEDSKKSIHEFDYKDILFLFGIYITHNKVIYNFNYKKPYNKLLPISSLGRACFFQLPIPFILKFLSNGCIPDDNMYCSIPDYEFYRQELLKIATKGKEMPLKDSEILNAILLKETWDLLELAISLGAKPIDGRLQNQTTNILSQIKNEKGPIAFERFRADLLQKIIRILPKYNNTIMTNNEIKNAWASFLST